MPRNAADPPPSAAHTPMALVRQVVLAYEQRGLDPATALHKAQIPPSDLRRPAAKVTALQFERLCAAAMQALDDEAPGWFSRRLPWGSYGMLARASIGAPTLGVALSRWCRHHGLLVGDVRLALSQGGGRASIGIAEQRDLGATRELALLSLLRNLHGLGCWMIDSQIPLHAAQFPFAAPPHAELYGRLFPGPVEFGAPQAALQFDAHYLQLPLRRDGAALDQMLRRALPIIVWPYRRDRLLALRVRQFLQAQPTHTAESLAAALALSPRTLHRQLAAEGHALQMLKDEVRRERAIDLLQRTPQPIKQVARAVGFGHEKSFHRAFRAWTGQTPEQCRHASTMPS
ncbi:MAG: AraC family transcriptional regulator [Ottowia sp.]|uniref:AraC family transcriptional regulator n=1 Tax=Ottowia sp. TaxID=1898956 RepID=UPI0039E60658